MKNESLTPRAIGVVAACTIGNFFSATPMVNSLFGLFLVPIARRFGWGRAPVSLGLAVLALVGVFAYPLAGRLADRVGVRKVALAGNLLFGAAFFSLSLMTRDLALYYLLFAILGAAAALPSTVLYAKTIANWFQARRGVMLGLTAGLGDGAGATIMPLVAAPLLVALGWRGAYRALAVMIVVIGFPALFLMLRDADTRSAAVNEPDGSMGPDLAVARRSPEFLVMGVAIGLGAGGLTAVFTHVIPMLMDKGSSLGLATTVLATFALTTTAWQLAMGAMLDRATGPRVAAPFFLAAMVGVLLVANARTPGWLIAGAVLMGLGLGTEYGLLPYWVPRYFGRRHYGAIYGAVYGAIVLVMGVTPFLMDTVFDATGSYSLAIDGVAAALALGAGLICLLRPYRYDAEGASAAPADDREARLA